MNEIEAHEMEIKKRRILWEQDGYCRYCGEFIKVGELYDLAHRLAKHKWRLEKFGPEVMHHRFNLVATHHNSRCNDGVMLNIEKASGRALLKDIFNDLCLELPEEFLK